ncbi:MAG: efflux RND transporter periplasmic adaptor subunit [Proteiniphilum sp.]|jgi:RND family efflux transporter MFP subunit|nr:efflux RND transporter periplasmic adaptor subunit [Proteiniphilum sp.]
MSKKILTGVVLVSALFSCSPDGGSKKEEAEKVTEVADDKPTEIMAMLLEHRDFNYELVSNGTVAALHKADLRFQSQEQIVKIYVKNGERVVKGQKLAELDRFKQQNSMEQAEESFERAGLDLQDVLIGQGYSPGDSARIPPDVLKIARIRSNYEQSRNSYELARYNLDMMTLYAPFGGVVANLTAKEYNRPEDPFCTIVDNGSPEVIFNILENELSFVNLNDKVIVSPFSLNTYSVEGRVSEINPVIDKNGMVRVKAVISNRDNKFYEGMNVRVRVQRQLGRQLVIPKSAVVLRTNKKVVFTLRNGRAMWNYVETAQENTDSYVLVPDKINAGDSVIYEGNMHLMDQAPVILERR